MIPYLFLLLYLFKRKKAEIQMEYSIEQLIRTLLETSHEKIRLRKVFQMNEEEVTHLKKSGEWYGFWCFVQTKKNPNCFVFGEMSIQNNSVQWSCKEQPFLYFAQVAYKKKWFDRDDIRLKKVVLQPQ